jgi:pimeloyl-ACP methyl ester carboxylesterase
MPDLARPEASLHYEISGDGPPLLMVAGLMSDGASWAPLIDLLEPHFTLIRPDNRTTGQTVPWDAPASMEHWVDDLLALLDHLGHDRAHVVGHSLGGMIGWALSARDPERVASLLMLGSSRQLPERNWHLFQSLIAVRRSNAPEDTWLRLLFPWLFHPELFKDPEALEAAIAASLAYPHAQSVDAFAHQLNSLSGTDPTAFLSPPPVPCRAILSRNDLLVEFESARRTLKGVDVVALDGPGHSMHWDAPETVATLIRDMVAENR